MTISESNYCHIPSSVLMEEMKQLRDRMMNLLLVVLGGCFLCKVAKRVRSLKEKKKGRRSVNAIDIQNIDRSVSPSSKYLTQANFSTIPLFPTILSTMFASTSLAVRIIIERRRQPSMRIQ